MECQVSDLKISLGQVELALFQALAETGGIYRAVLALLAYKNIRKTAMARQLGVDMTVIDRYWRQGSAPAVRIEQLRALGVPEFLLPRPSGRQPKGYVATQNCGREVV